ncbi:hypothetical protein BDZ94DRAFT_1330022 [Collybia nuda]|uniref:DUF6534 domain-containing protein n=1 Tax=Collybia nuda TaxID=64659 RepID=A0A9P5YD61_9AGAR|nr:hypothetical protein BDZ94DRAFT_1330022 [Collybia nuda]
MNRPTTEFNLGPSYGPVLIGAFLETALWGMTTVQTILYFINYGSKDRWHIKTVVLVNFGLTSALVVAITSSVYLPLISHFGNVLVLRDYPWYENLSTLANEFLLNKIVLKGSSGRLLGFFRLSLFSTSKASSCSGFIDTPFVLATLALGLVADIQVIRDPSRAAADAKLGNINVACEAVMSATDFLLAGLLIFYLRRREPKMTRETPTNVVIARLIKYTIGTGALTGIMEQRPSLTWPSLLLYHTDFIFGYILARIANMDRMNSRKLVAKPWKDDPIPSKELSTVRFNHRTGDRKTTWDENYLWHRKWDNTGGIRGRM